MNFGKRLSWLCGVALLVSSCDRAKRLVDDVKDKVSGAGNKEGAAVVPAKSASEEQPVDPGLQAKVDGGGGTYRFRKDLPFPQTFSVRMTERVEYLEGRMLLQSALGREGVPLHANLEAVSRVDMAPGAVTLTIEKPMHVVVVPDKDGKLPELPPAPVAADSAELEGKTARFGKTDGGWKMVVPAGERDFKTYVWGQSVERHLDPLLCEAGATPRKLWFSPRGRLSPGGTVNLRGQEVGMVFAGATGNLKLVLESVGAVNGHPCGVFQISGEIDVKGMPEMDGGLTDATLSVTSGKVWLSLLYPLVLKEDMQIIESMVTGLPGGAMMRAEGKVHHLVEREWLSAGAAK